MGPEQYSMLHVCFKLREFTNTGYEEHERGQYKLPSAGVGTAPEDGQEDEAAPHTPRSRQLSQGDPKIAHCACA
jgi:hypothetical protein